MFCQKCGHKNADNASFCSACGEQLTVYVTEANTGFDLSQGTVDLCPDGKYRWRYEMSLFKNPTYFWLVWKIFFFIILGIFAMAMIFDTIDWGIEHAAGNLPFLLYLLIGMTVLTVIGYLIYAAIMDGKYIVDFEMDENGINHVQAPMQAKKAKAIGAATMAAGFAAGRMTTVGVGLNAQRTEMYSDFSRVKKIKAYPKRNTIKVNETLNHNQVYASDRDFEFVKNFIIAHCPNLKSK